MKLVMEQKSKSGNIYAILTLDQSKLDLMS